MHSAVCMNIQSINNSNHTLYFCIYLVYSLQRRQWRLPMPTIALYAIQSVYDHACLNGNSKPCSTVTSSLCSNAINTFHTTSHIFIKAMSLESPEVSSYTPKVAAFCLVMGGLSLSILNSLSGNLANIDKYIASRHWSFLKADDGNYLHYLRYFRLIICSLIFMCPVAYAVWVGTLFYYQNSKDGSMIAPVAVLMVGLAIMCSCLGIFYVKWHNYRLSCTSTIFFTIGAASFFIYQLCGNFLDVTKRSFFGISAVFISYNAVLFMIVVFLNSGKRAVNFMDILSDKVPIKSENNIMDAKQEFAQQIAAQEANKDYVVTKEEIDDFFTVKEEKAPLLGGGLIRRFSTMSSSMQSTLTLIIYACSVGVLVGYAFIVYESTEEYKLGFITLIAVLTTDTIMYSFYYVGVSQSVLQLCFMSIVFRVCLFGFGGTYWYYGYCLLYGILGVIVCGNIAAKYFPLMDALQASYSDPSNPSVLSSKYLRDLMKTPEFILIYSTVLFTILTIAVGVADPDGVPLPSLSSSTTEYPYWSFALLAFGVVILSYLLMAIVRILIRRKQQIIDNVHVYFFVEFLDLFWIHIYLCYGLFILGGLIAYGLSDDPTYLICACFLPMAAILLIYVYIYYSANDYHVLKDIKAENTKRRYLKKTKSRKATLQRQTMDARGVVVEDYKNSQEDGPPSEPPKSPVMSPMRGNTLHKNVLALQNTPSLSQPMSRGNAPANALELALQETQATDELEDWRETHNVFTAFFAGKLHGNDYRVIFGCIGIVIMLFLNSLILQLTNDYDNSWYGVTLGFLLFDTFLVLAGTFKHLRTDLRLSLGNIIVVSLGIILHVVYGIIYFMGQESADLDIHNNLVWIWTYVIFVPAFIAILTGLYKWYAKKWAINVYTIVMTAIVVVLAILFMIFVWNRYGSIGGIIVLVLTALSGYGAVLTYFYAANNYFLPHLFYMINIILFCLAACAVMVASWVIDDFVPFIGFSVTYGIIVGGGLIYFFVKLVNSCRDYQTAPVFISPYVFPTFIYNPHRKTSISYNFHTIGLYLSICLTIFWGILLSIYVQPMHYGISVTCFAVIVIAFMTFFLITYTSIKLQECQEFISSKVLSKSWLKAKKRFIENQNALCLDELASYKELQDAQQAVFTRRGTAISGKIRLSSQEVLNVDVTRLTNKQQEDILFDIEKEMRERYYDEIQLMIDFQLMCMIGAIHYQLKFQKKIADFLKAKEGKLLMFGIEIKYKAIADPAVRHSIIMSQVERLTPHQRVKYDELLEEFEAELEEQRKKNEEIERQAKEAEEARMRKIMELEREKQRQKEEAAMATDLPIEKMPDSLEKYKKIKEKYKGSIFVDTQFPANEQSLGESVKTRAGGWKQADPSMILYEKGICAMDVKQGLLGDCYYLSAISVLGEKYVQQCIENVKDEEKCGAYCVRFFKGGEEKEYVIVDCQFPTLPGSDQWAFAKSEDKNELWPMVLEKAYAKLYGSYENIEGGKVQYALADLTGGAPEQIKLENVADNLDEFWKKIYEYYKDGYLMGAGTPEHPNGDMAISMTGIVQGHAYSVLELAEFENEKLIKLRNPHGSRGAEWMGDWCDGSPMWSEAAKTLLKYEEKDDGAFWMSLQDFVSEYANLYVCRIFDDKWKFMAQSGVWEGKTAAGLPCRANRGAKIENNPHYLLRVTRPCTMFVKLTQKEKLNMFNGKESIYFLIANNDGERVNRVSSDITVASSYPPTNLITVSSEVILDSSFTYPIDLTVMVSTMAGGPQVKSSYTLKVYCTDKNFTLTPMDQTYSDYF
eukprot:TRINITY_DN70944_c4_g1_i1.p1 TRINITY_DN70944_c4_g1~~TRINITY_DN70944_c4_g1_i1.p1  ORF type:complete len:1780 (-),score=174.97 TRINITY_DN70944_c4_g1_i1:1708-7047(-)